MRSAHLTPGEVITTSWPITGQFHIARWPSEVTTSRDLELLNDIAATWTPLGINVRLPRDVAPWKYNKLLHNLSNAIVALTGCNEHTELTNAIIAEGERVLRDAGIDYIAYEQCHAELAKDGPVARPVDGSENTCTVSTWQSLARGIGSVEDRLPQRRNRATRPPSRTNCATQFNAGRIGPPCGAPLSKTWQPHYDRTPKPARSRTWAALLTTFRSS